MVLSWFGLEHLARNYKCKKKISWELGNPVYYNCTTKDITDEHMTDLVLPISRLISISPLLPSGLDYYVLKRQLKSDYIYFV